MRARNWGMLVCLVAASCGWVGKSHAQGPQVPAEMKVLEHEVGKWTAEMKIWAEGPNADPMVVKATEVNELKLGGFWIVSQFEADMFGSKYSGMGQFGYDPKKKKYIGTWTESMSPYLSVMEGDYDAATKSFTYETMMMDSQTNQPVATKIVTKMIDKDHRVMTMYAAPSPGADPVKTMEVNYTRAK